MRAFLLIIALVLITGCTGGNEPSGEVAIPTPTTQALETATITAPQPDLNGIEEQVGADVLKPGEGVTVNMARGNWSTGYFQAEILRALLQELGYQVPDPNNAELAPDIFYLALAQGDFDFWGNSWYPLHYHFLAGELADGSLVSDHVSVVGALMQGLQGFLVDKATAEVNGIVTLADIGNNPDIATLFDIDGNGKADLFGCNDGWGCQIVINDTIAHNGWEDTIEQISGDYSALWLDVVSRHDQGRPVLYYMWIPTAYITQLVPGQDVIWLSVPNPMEDQRGAAPLPADECPGQPCELGFEAADISVTANNTFLAANPVAAHLLELVMVNPVDVALQNVRLQLGENTEEDIHRHAAEWIEANQDVVDAWLTAARNAG